MFLDKATASYYDKNAIISKIISTIENMSSFSPDLCHNNLIEAQTPQLRYREDNDFDT